jgi:hypothetical protein
MRHMRHERHHAQNNKDRAQYLRNADRVGGYPAKANGHGDECQHKEAQRPIQYGSTFSMPLHLAFFKRIQQRRALIAARLRPIHSFSAATARPASAKIDANTV